MNYIQIEDFKIGSGENTFIIAEAGLNHDGNFDQAKELIKKAFEVKADAVKFQIFKTEEFCSKNSEYYNLFKSLELKEEEWIELIEFANKIGILFTASVFGKESTDFLYKENIHAYKTASGDLTYLQLLNHIGNKNKPIIISTGMATIGEIEEALNEIHKTGNQKVAILHCVSNYPTNYEETNLNVIRTLKNLFNIPVGFSDHTNGTIVPAIAVSLGADIIEKHFTLDKNLPGPDHKLSLEPYEFEIMVENIRITEKSLGDGIKRPSESKKMISTARRSILTNEVIKKGTNIEKEMLKIVRPAIGIKPKYLDFIHGKVLNKDLSEETPIKWEDIK